MKKIYLSILGLTIGFSSIAQEKGICTTDFEGLTLSSESHWDGSDLTGGFTTNCLQWNFANVYDTAFGGYWAAGWAYSNETDVATAGNQFSSFVGSGFGGSDNYAVASAYGNVGLALINIGGISMGVDNPEFFVSTSTYAAQSMLNGDTFGKVFGDSLDALGAVDGTNGEDWYKLTVYGFMLGGLVDSQEVYLADYRFSNDSLDYISDNWNVVLMSGFMDSLNFVLSSSDVGSFGMNTPAFFCLDHITGDYATSIGENEIAELSFYPNPATDQILIKDAAGQLEIYSIDGQLVQATQVFGTGSLDVSALSKGIYQMVLRQAVGISTAKLIKQ
jgi:hypothetical protein